MNTLLLEQGEYVFHEFQNGFKVNEKIVTLDADLSIETREDFYGNGVVTGKSSPLFSGKYVSYIALDIGTRNKVAIISNKLKKNPIN